MDRPDGDPARLPLSMTDPRIMDPDSEIVDRSRLSAQDVDEIAQVLAAMQEWNETERRMSEESRRYMRLGETDMRALRFLLASERHGITPTAGAIASHLGVSAAATTKLLDRLEAGNHIVRRPHPADRRSIAITVTNETRRAARATVGRSHARRFDAIARLSSDERETVLHFLRGLIESGNQES